MDGDVGAVLDAVITPLATPVALANASEFWRDHRAATARFTSPIDRAIVSATRVDRLGYAFAGGYAAALQSMVPSLGAETLASLAATEEGGNHPRAIATTLRRDADGWRLDGEKKWVTLGPEGGVILVVARVEPSASSERPTLRVVRVASNAAGATITTLPDMPFVPEIPHASLSLANVRVQDDDVLAGDGYDAYLKPFRTIEDVYVHAAVLAWLGATMARLGAPRALREKIAAALLSARSLAHADPRALSTHVALGGLIAQSRALIDEAEPSWAAASDAERARWARDRALLGIAGKARAARLEAAWSRLVASS